MIATGGLLRINARRQDSLHSKTRAENRRKRKAKRKRRSEVVVVRGKLQLCSVSGLVAAVGVAILLVGVAMAVLGYWPRDSLLYTDSPRADSLHYPSATKADGLRYPAAPGAAWGRELGNRSEGTNSTGLDQLPRSFLEDFLDRHLYSDRLKVLGPLIMGIGIFLFICANAVLHENRDKKTKIINLRDIYSTVIDIHSLRSKDRTPINGFVNYVQSKGVEVKPSAAYAAALLAKTSWPSTGGGRKGGREEDGEGLEASSRRSSLVRLGGAVLEKPLPTDTVYSICQEHGQVSTPPPLSPPSCSSPFRWDAGTSVASSVHSFTLPLTHSFQRSGHQHQRRPSARAEAGRRGSRAGRGDWGGEIRGKVQTSSTRDWVEESRSSYSLQGAPQGSQAQLLSSSPDHTPRLTASHLSLNTSPPACRTVDRSRRLSCPRIDCSVSAGYTKLGDLGGESFESTEVATFSQVTSEETLDRGQRLPAAVEKEEGTEVRIEAVEDAIEKKYSNKEKLMMISQTDSGLDQSEEGGSDLGQEKEGLGT